MNDHEKKIVATYEECGSLDKTAKANALSEEQVAEVLQKAEVYEDRKRRFERYEGNKKVRDIETVTGEEVIHGTETDHVITEEQERQFLEEYINELSPESGHFTGKKKSLSMACSFWIKHGDGLILDMLRFTNKDANEISIMTGEPLRKVKRIISKVNFQRRLKKGTEAYIRDCL